MNLEGLINISGKNGLFKVISNSKNMIIVESLVDKKRIPVHSGNQANMLEEIGIYTYNDTKPLSSVFEDIAKKENYNQTISHKLSKNELTDVSGIEVLESLEYLQLHGNMIRSLDHLEQLTQISTLKHLYLF